MLVKLNTSPVYLSAGVLYCKKDGIPSSAASFDTKAVKQKKADK
jgi:hypothetical protein